MGFRGRHVTIASNTRASQFTGPTAYAFDGWAVRGRLTESAVDEAGAESFPASDPPPWTPGVARPRPLRRGRDEDRPMDADAETRQSTGDDPDGQASLPRRFREAAVSLAGAIGVVLLVPIAILIVGLPIALAVRGVATMVSWIWAALG